MFINQNICTPDRICSSIKTYAHWIEYVHQSKHMHAGYKIFILHISPESICDGNVKKCTFFDRLMRFDKAICLIKFIYIQYFISR